jgi:hypothetical protein
MESPLIDALLGVLIGAVCIGLPRLVRKRRQRPDDDDTQAYLKETGRSARDIAQDNAALRSRQQNDVRPKQNGVKPKQASGSDSPAAH